MRIEVTVHGDLSKTGGGVTRAYRLADGATALDALRAVAVRHPRVLERNCDLPPDVNVLVNGRSLRGLGGLPVVLHEGDRLHILRAFGGG